jgi:hypothetical protein
MELGGIVVEEDAVNVVGVGFEEEVRKRLRREGLVLLRREHLGGGGDLGGKRRREEAMMVRVGVQYGAAL